jgi:hypothetical protein
MNPHFEHIPLPPTHTVAAAALATVVALAISWGVTILFQSRGEPFAELAAAERACSQHTSASGQRDCMQRWVAAHTPSQVAKR